MSSAPAPADHRSTRPFSPRRLSIATIAATIVNVIVFAIASAAGAAMAVEQPAFQEIPLLVVVIASVVPLAVAGVVTWLLGVRFPGLPPIAAWAGFVVAIATAVSPLLVAADTATGIALGLMHVFPGIAWFVGVRRLRVAATVPATA